MTNFTGHLADATAQRLVDGALPAAEAAEAERHVAGCLTCTATVESYRMLAGALEDLEIPDLPLDFTAGVLARIVEDERAAVRERRWAIAILAGVVGATAAVFAVAGASAWAPTVSALAEGFGGATRAFRIGSTFVPTLVSALRLQIVLVAAAFTLPLLVALARLIPAPRAETA